MDHIRFIGVNPAATARTDNSTRSNLEGGVGLAVRPKDRTDLAAPGFAHQKIIPREGIGIMYSWQCCGIRSGKFRSHKKYTDAWWNHIRWYHYGERSRWSYGFTPTDVGFSRRKRR